MIRKVVDKPKAKINTRYPEFDDSKVYIMDCEPMLCKIEETTEGFRLVHLGTSVKTSTVYNSFQDASYSPCYETYILDNQHELARFILGCREFPKLNNVESSKDQLSEDEISIDDINIDGIFGTNNGCILSDNNNNTYSFHRVGRVSTNFHATKSSTVKGCIKRAHELGNEVFYFDTEREFFTFALENVND